MTREKPKAPPRKEPFVKKTKEPPKTTATVKFPSGVGIDLLQPEPAPRAITGRIALRLANGKTIAADEVSQITSEYAGNYDGAVQYEVRLYARATNDWHVYAQTWDKPKAERMAADLTSQLFGFVLAAPAYELPPRHIREKVFTPTNDSREAAALMESPVKEGEVYPTTGWALPGHDLPPNLYESAPQAEHYVARHTDNTEQQGPLEDQYPDGIPYDQLKEMVQPVRIAGFAPMEHEEPASQGVQALMGISYPGQKHFGDSSVTPQERDRRDAEEAGFKVITVGQADLERAQRAVGRTNAADPVVAAAEKDGFKIRKS